MSSVEPPEELLSAYLDGEVTADERAVVEARLAESPEWRAVLEEVRETRTLLQGLPRQDAPPGFWESVLAPDEPGVARDEPAPIPIESARSRRTKRVVAWVAGAAAAAAIVAVVMVPNQSRVKPAVATLVNQHAARSSVTEEPLSQLAPVTNRVRLR